RRHSGRVLPDPQTGRPRRDHRARVPLPVERARRGPDAQAAVRGADAEHTRRGRRLPRPPEQLRTLFPLSARPGPAPQAEAAVNPPARGPGQARPTVAEHRPGTIPAPRNPTPPPRPFALGPERRGRAPEARNPPARSSPDAVDAGSSSGQRIGL